MEKVMKQQRQTYSMGIGIDPLVPLIRSLSEEVGDQVVSPTALFVNSKKDFCRAEALIPVYITRGYPGNMDDILTITLNVYNN